MLMLCEQDQHLYLFGNVEHNWFKIGVSRNPPKRMAGFQEWMPFQLTLLFDRNVTTHGFRVEKILHERYANKRQRGEWFRDICLEEFTKTINKVLKGGF